MLKKKGGNAGPPRKSKLSKGSKVGKGPTEINPPFEEEERKDQEAEDEQDIEQDDVLLQLELAFPEKPKDAKDLSTKEVTRELEVRSVRPSGFYSDDVRILQQLYNKEFEEQLQEAQARRDEYFLKKQQEKELEKEKHREALERAEERKALKTHPRAAFWVKVIGSSSCPQDAQLSSITPPLLRALSRSVSKTSRLLSLDLSHSRFDAASGKLLSIALCRNTSIKRLELEDCNVMSDVIGSFAKVLEENETLAHISLENNPLTGVDRDHYDGLQRFSAALAVNKTLLMLNLWRCELGIKGGSILASDLKENTTLLSLGVGCNNISPSTEKEIHTLLERNAQIKERLDFEAKREQDRLQERERQIREQEEQVQKRLEEDEWLERRKIERAQAREQAKLDEIQRLEEEKQRKEEERLRLEEEERLRQEAKKRKKKGKKGKKTKK